MNCYCSVCKCTCELVDGEIVRSCEDINCSAPIIAELEAHATGESKID